MSADRGPSIEKDKSRLSFYLNGEPLTLDAIWERGKFAHALTCGELIAGRIFSRNGVFYILLNTTSMVGEGAKGVCLQSSDIFFTYSILPLEGQPAYRYMQSPVELACNLDTGLITLQKFSEDVTLLGSLELIPDQELEVALNDFQNWVNPLMSVYLGLSNTSPVLTV